MKVRRIVANIATPDTEKAKAFCQGLPGLDMLMDHGWIKTFGSNEITTFQVNAASLHQRRGSHA